MIIGEQRRRAAVTLLFAVLTGLLAYPLTIHPADHVVGPPVADTQLYLWTFAWDVHAFTHQPLRIFDANIYYPFRDTLAFSENLIGSAAIAAPVIWATGNVVLGMNVFILLSVVLCGLGAYMLARAIGVGVPGAVVTGIVFAFSPARFLRIDQLHLASIQWIPFGLASLHTYFAGQRPAHARWAAAFFALQALSSGHGAVFLTLAVIALIAYRTALGEPIAFGRCVRDLGIPGLLLLASAVLVFVPYATVQREAGLRRTLENWVITPASFVASPSHVHQWLISFFPAARINETADAELFPGVLPIVLAVCAVVWGQARSPAEAGRHRQEAGDGHKAPAGVRLQPDRAGFDRVARFRLIAVVVELLAVASLGVAIVATVRGPFRVRIGTAVVFSVHQLWRPWIVVAVLVALRAALARRVPLYVVLRLRQSRDTMRRWALAQRSDMRTFYTLLMIGSFWLTLGPPIGLWPLVYWLPGFNFIRVPSRFILLAILALAVLAGIGFERLASGWGLKHRGRLAAAIVAGALLVGEFAAMPLELEPYRIEIPAIDRWLAGQPTPFVVAEVPLPNPRHLGAWERRETAFMLHATAHWQKTVHGYSGTRVALHTDLFTALRSFPDERSLALLKAVGVTYVVVHPGLYEPGEWAVVERRLGGFEQELIPARVDGQDRVYALVSASARTQSR